VLSANKQISDTMSLMNIKNKTGSITQPWRTSEFMFLELGDFPFNTTFKSVSELTVNLG